MGQGLFAGDAEVSEPPQVDDLDGLVAIVESHGDVYVRYSKGPAADFKSGPSRDYEAGVDLPGLSVTTVAPEPWWPRATVEWLARRIFKYEELGQAEGRYPWLLTGDIAGYGPDHEPLVVNARPIARIGTEALRQARRVYQEHFDVGRGSV